MDLVTVDFLRALAVRYESPSFLNGDPSWFMHQVEGPLNREYMAFIASSLSFGSRCLFFPKIEYILGRSDGCVYDYIVKGAYQDDIGDDERPFYRFYTNGVFRRFLDRLREVSESCGSLGQYVKREGDGTGLGAVRVITNGFQGTSVIPRDASSCCKRVCMFLRWMVRDGSPVDLGLWSSFIDKSTLIIPLDTHVMKESRRLGLLTVRSATMSAALGLSRRLAEIFPGDPCRGDYALFGLGVGGEQ